MTNVYLTLVHFQQPTFHAQLLDSHKRSGLLAQLALETIWPHCAAKHVQRSNAELSPGSKIAGNSHDLFAGETRQAAIHHPLMSLCRKWY